MSSRVLVCEGVNTSRLLSSWPRPATKVPGATSALVNDPSTMSAPRKVDTSKVVSDWSLTSAALDLAVADVHGLDLPVDDVRAADRVGRIARCRRPAHRNTQSRPSRRRPNVGAASEQSGKHSYVPLQRPRRRIARVRQPTLSPRGPRALHRTRGQGDHRHAIATGHGLLPDLGSVRIRGVLEPCGRHRGISWRWGGGSEARDTISTAALWGVAGPEGGVRWAGSCRWGVVGPRWRW